MTVFIIEYRVEGYSLADCMRPDPKWGKRIFTISSAEAGTSDINEIAAASQTPENTPKNHRLFSVRNRDTGQQVTP